MLGLISRLMARLRPVTAEPLSEIETAETRRARRRVGHSLAIAKMKDDRRHPRSIASFDHEHPEFGLIDQKTHRRFQDLWREEDKQSGPVPPGYLG